MARCGASITFCAAAQVGVDANCRAAPHAKAASRHMEVGCIIVPSFPMRRAVLGPAAAELPPGSPSLAEAAACAQKACLECEAEKATRMGHDGQTAERC